MTLRCMQFIMLSIVTVAGAAAQQPTFETRKITDNVYAFRYVGHQSMFVVTPEGVIATDPISYLRPQAAQAYIAEIRKVTNAPIKAAIKIPRLARRAADPTRRCTRPRCAR